MERKFNKCFKTKEIINAFKFLIFGSNEFQILRPYSGNPPTLKISNLFQLFRNIKANILTVICMLILWLIIIMINRFNLTLNSPLISRVNNVNSSLQKLKKKYKILKSKDLTKFLNSTNSSISIITLFSSSSMNSFLKLYKFSNKTEKSTFILLDKIKFPFLNKFINKTLKK